MAMTPEQREVRARLAALARWSREDPKPHMKMMSDKFLERFENEVDPDRVLPEEERKRRALAARRAYYVTLSYKSSRARSRG